MRPWQSTCVVYWAGAFSSKDGFPATQCNSRDVSKHRMVYKSVLNLLKTTVLKAHLTPLPDSGWVECWNAMEAKWGGHCISAVTTAMWKASHAPDFYTQLWQHEMENILISSFTQILGLQLGELYTELNIYYSASERVMATLKYCTRCATLVP